MTSYILDECCIVSEPINPHERYSYHHTIHTSANEYINGIRVHIQSKPYDREYQPVLESVVIWSNDMKATFAIGFTNQFEIDKEKMLLKYPEFPTLWTGVSFTMVNLCISSICVDTIIEAVSKELSTIRGTNEYTSIDKARWGAVARREARLEAKKPHEVVTLNDAIKNGNITFADYSLLLLKRRNVAPQLGELLEKAFDNEFLRHNKDEKFVSDVEAATGLSYNDSIPYFRFAKLDSDAYTGSVNSPLENRKRINHIEHVLCIILNNQSRFMV